MVSCGGYLYNRWDSHEGFSCDSQSSKGREIEISVIK